MNRHLHNTLSALSASGALLVLGLIGAAPLTSPDGRPAQTLITTTSDDIQPGSVTVAMAGAESTAEATAVVLLANAIGQATTQAIDASPPPRATRSSTRVRRQTLVMPYLSFLPRG